MPDIVARIGELSSFIGSLTVVGGALMWIYNKFIAEKREKKRQEEADKRQNTMIELITEKNEPLNQAIENLNLLLAESQADRKQLNQIAKVNTDMIKNHEDRIDNHNERLIVLETKNGIQKIAYREGSEEG